MKVMHFVPSYDIVLTEHMCRFGQAPRLDSGGESPLLVVVLDGEERAALAEATDREWPECLTVEFGLDHDVQFVCEDSRLHEVFSVLPRPDDDLRRAAMDLQVAMIHPFDYWAEHCGLRFWASASEWPEWHVLRVVPQGVEYVDSGWWPADTGKVLWKMTFNPQDISEVDYGGVDYEEVAPGTDIGR